jgi:hypothetical protein
MSFVEILGKFTLFHVASPLAASLTCTHAKCILCLRDCARIYDIALDKFTYALNSVQLTATFPATAYPAVGNTGSPMYREGAAATVSAAGLLVLVGGRCLGSDSNERWPTGEKVQRVARSGSQVTR